MKKYYVLFLMLLALSCTAQENIIEKRECCEDITVETPIFTVYYSESKQQPIT